MGLLTMELLAVGARILLCLVVLILLLFSASTLQLRTLGFSCIFVHMACILLQTSHWQNSHHMQI
jgi:hypothetical protein